jgi:hypothetical protein
VNGYLVVKIFSALEISKGLSFAVNLLDVDIVLEGGLELLLCSVVVRVL